MSLESATKVSQLVATNPTGSDPKSQGDDHLRMIKLVLQNNAIKSEIGQSATPANNFSLDASADNGTMKLARQSGQDIMTVNAAGIANFAAMVSALGSPIVEFTTISAGRNAIKFADGTLVCFGTSTAATGAWTSAGDFSYSPMGGLDLFAVPFVSVPFAMSWCNDSDISARSAYVVNMTITTTGISGGFFASPASTAPASGNVSVSYLAIGRWK